MSSQFAINVENLSKRYVIGHQARYDTLTDRVSAFFQRKRGVRPKESEEFWALRDVSFTIEKGEVIGIIGRNGAGKSTLLKLLSRIVDPSEGRVTLRGRMASLLEVGTGFHPELTGRENIFLNGAILGMSRVEIRARFDEIVAFADVEKFLDTPVKHYSSGMYVRLAFAVAAHLDPEIMVVDEVLAVGDTDFQAKCLGKMNRLAKTDGRTVLLVSHNLASIGSLATRTLWLDGGRLRFAGPTHETIAQYITNVAPTAGQIVDLVALRPTGRESFAILLTKFMINGGAPVRHGESWEIELQFETRAPVEGVGFGVGVNTVEGVRIASIDSDIQGQKASYRAGVKGRAVLRLPRCDLTPGPYRIDLSTRTRQYTILDDFPGCAQFDVHAGPSTPSLVEHGKGGGLRLVADWKYEF